MINFLRHLLCPGTNQSSHQCPISRSRIHGVQPRTGCQGLTHSKLVGKTETSQQSTHETLEEKTGVKEGRVLSEVTRFPSNGVRSQWDLKGPYSLDR